MENNQKENQKKLLQKKLKENCALVAISRHWEIKDQNGSVTNSGVTEDLYLQYTDYKGELRLARIDSWCPKTEGPKFKAMCRKELVEVAHLNPFNGGEENK